MEAKTAAEIAAMTDTDHMRYWCSSVEETHQPRLEDAIPRGEMPTRLPETFLAHAIDIIRDLCDKLDATRRVHKMATPPLGGHDLPTPA